MKIGDEVMVHGYVDEIRNDCVIIRNEGGYFGTVASEVELKGGLITDEVVLKAIKAKAEQTESTISKTEMVQTEPTTEDCSMVEPSCQECNWWNPIKRACSIADVGECDYKPITVISLSEDEYEEQTDCQWK